MRRGVLRRVVIGGTVVVWALVNIVLVPFGRVAADVVENDIDEGGGVEIGVEVKYAPPSSSLKISKVQIGTAENKQAEFIEVYNSSELTMNLNGLAIEFLGESWSLGNAKPTRVLAAVDLDLALPPFEAYVWAYRDYLADDADFEFASSSGAAGSISANGSVRLVYDGVVLDSVGWNGGPVFESEPVKTAAVSETFGRCVDADMLMVDTENSAADFYNAEALELRQMMRCPENEESDDDPELGLEPENLCLGLRLNEIGANLDVAEQFVEITNESDEVADLNGCRVGTEKSKHAVELGKLELAAGDVYLVELADVELSLIKTTSDTVLLLDSGGETVDSVRYEKLKEGTSYAKFASADGAQWRQTYAMTPGAANEYEQYAPCAAGYERNLVTGRCRRVVEEEEVVVADCGEGKFRNPATGRCKSYPTTAALAACQIGYYRNPDTNRCRKIEPAAAGPAPCQEGYERNPDTNRCRKIRNNAGADYGLSTVASVADGSSSAALVVLLAATGLGAFYVVFQFRSDIGRFLKKVLRCAGK